jgi:hypothetical protein
MGLFDFIKKKETDKKGEIPTKEEMKKYLDAIQAEIFSFLKPLGFKKKGRTFNRETETGIYQVINLQSGRYEFGDTYVIPGLRENFYGKFTVNLGISIKELYELGNHNKPTNFYHEYDCQIRDRLPHLTMQKDFWWTISSNTKGTANEIIEGLSSQGLNWLDAFDNREKICKTWGTDVAHGPRAKLDVALITFKVDKEKGEKLIQAYYDNIDHKGHKEYVTELSKRLGLKLKNSE